MKKLESLEAWKLGKTVSRTAYRLTMQEPLKQHFRLSEQIRGSAISIPANIAEGYEDLGQRELAMEWLAQALDNGLTVDWIERRPSFNSLRSDVRYRELVEQSTN